MYKVYLTKMHTVLLWFDFCIQFIMLGECIDMHSQSIMNCIHILQGCFTGTEIIATLPGMSSWNTWVTFRWIKKNNTETKQKTTKHAFWALIFKSTDNTVTIPLRSPIVSSAFHTSLAAHFHVSGGSEGNLVQEEGWFSLPAVIARKFHQCDFCSLCPDSSICSRNPVMVVLIFPTSVTSQSSGHLK